MWMMNRQGSKNNLIRADISQPKYNIRRRVVLAFLQTPRHGFGIIASAGAPVPHNSSSPCRNIHATPEAPCHSSYRSAD
jgi:hypothetical protein